MTRLKSARLAAGFTLASLSEATGGKMKTSRIANYDSGKRKVTQDAAEVLAPVLNVSAAYLLGMGESSALDGSFDALSPAHKELYVTMQKISKLSPEQATAGKSILKAFLSSLSK